MISRLVDAFLDETLFVAHARSSRNQRTIARTQAGSRRRAPSDRQAESTARSDFASRRLSPGHSLSSAGTAAEPPSEAQRRRPAEQRATPAFAEPPAVRNRAMTDSARNE